MTQAVLEGIAIRGIRACVPKQSRTLEDEGLIDDPAERERLMGSIGVRSRHIARPEIMTSDLCHKAADSLLAQLGWARDTIDVLIFVSQSADYVLPATACLLQDRLGLGSCLAFDVNLGCSGYTYGLWTAASLLKGIAAEGRPARALLLAGDVSTSRLLKEDRATVPLFGDAGTATALEVDAAADRIFGVFGTDGSGGRHIIVEAGGMKMPLLPTKTPLDDDAHEQLYRAARLYLNGAEVFTFTLKNVPALVKAIFAQSGATPDDIDYAIFHQANAFMLEHLRKKSGLSTEKVPVAMETFGNTSSASIPLAICARLSEQLDSPKSALLVGFGVGWSWGALKVTLGPMLAPGIDYYD